MIRKFFEDHESSLKICGTALRLIWQRDLRQIVWEQEFLHVMHLFIDYVQCAILLKECGALWAKDHRVFHWFVVRVSVLRR